MIAAFRLLCCAGCLLAGAVPVLARAQAEPAGAAIADGDLSPSATNNNVGPSGLIPLTRGFNASLIVTGQHDSSIGWAGVLTPSVAYRFNKFLSADASAPVYATVNVFTSTTATQLKTRHAVAGDTAIAGHLGLPVYRSLSYVLTPTLGLPTGNHTYGLGAGQTTYDVNNHFEVDLPLSPYVEMGFGDASDLLNRRVKRNQTSIGDLVHFEAGGSLDLPHHGSFDVSAYEFLPLGNQTVTTVKAGRKKTTTASTTGPAEDNGINTSVDLPVLSHVTLSGFYSRSIRQHDDTAGVSLTLFARPRHFDDDK